MICSLTSPLEEKDVKQLLDKMSYCNLIEEVSDVNLKNGCDE